MLQITLLVSVNQKGIYCVNEEEPKILPYSDQEYRGREKKDNPVIPPRFATILRKPPYQVLIYPDPITETPVSDC